MTRVAAPRKEEQRSQAARQTRTRPRSGATQLVSVIERANASIHGAFRGLRSGRSRNAGHTAPRTDPYVRNCRIRLLPWVMTRTFATDRGCNDAALAGISFRDAQIAPMSSAHFDCSCLTLYAILGKLLDQARQQWSPLPPSFPLFQRGKPHGHLRHRREPAPTLKKGRISMQVRVLLARFA